MTVTDVGACLGRAIGTVRIVRRDESRVSTTPPHPGKTGYRA